MSDEFLGTFAHSEHTPKNSHTSTENDLPLAGGNLRNEWDSFWAKVFDLITLYLDNTETDLVKI